MQKTLVTIIVILFLAASCSKSDGPADTVGGGGNGGGGGGGGIVVCTNVPKTFAADVNPIIQSFCNIAGCHNSGSFNGPGALTNYTQVFNAQAQIRSAISSGLMPQNTTLSTAQKNSIICWIDAGAMNN